MTQYDITMPQWFKKCIVNDVAEKVPSHDLVQLERVRITSMENWSTVYLGHLISYLRGGKNKSKTKWDTRVALHIYIYQQELSNWIYIFKFRIAEWNFPSNDSLLFASLCIMTVHVYLFLAYVWGRVMACYISQFDKCQDGCYFISP